MTANEGELSDAPLGAFAPVMLGISGILGTGDDKELAAPRVTTSTERRTCGGPKTKAATGTGGPATGVRGNVNGVGIVVRDKGVFEGNGATLRTDCLVAVPTTAFWRATVRRAEFNDRAAGRTALG